MVGAAGDARESSRLDTASGWRDRVGRWIDSEWFAVLLTLGVLAAWCVSGLALVIVVGNDDSLPPPPPRSVLPDFDGMSQNGTWDGRPSSTEFYVFYDADDGQSAGELLSAASSALEADGWEVALGDDVVSAVKAPYGVRVFPHIIGWSIRHDVNVSLAFTSPEAAEEFEASEEAALRLRVGLTWGFTLALTLGWGAVLYRRIGPLGVPWSRIIRM